MMAVREGLQEAAAQWALVNSTPLAARRSRFGVLVCEFPPRQPTQSLRSSIEMKRTLGREESRAPKPVPIIKKEKKYEKNRKEKCFIAMMIRIGRFSSKPLGLRICGILVQDGFYQIQNGFLPWPGFGFFSAGFPPGFQIAAGVCASFIEASILATTSGWSAAISLASPRSVSRL